MKNIVELPKNRETQLYSQSAFDIVLLFEKLRGFQPGFWT
jgi:hypothetical protein